jgi:serine acetyltransferase
MDVKKPKLEIAEQELIEQKPKREYADPSGSSRGGFSGFLETVLRRFKNLVHLSLILPIYGLGCLAIGLAAVPGIAIFEFVHALAPEAPKILSYFVTGAALGAGYFSFGFGLLFVMPLINFCLRTNLAPWRGPYYSLEAVRWYVHNGATYLARFLFLEFVTPTPFNILFYRMMGMKIGRGSAINTTHISDPSLIELGEKVTLGGSVTLIGHYGQGGYLVLAPTKIGNRVTIGLKATIMGGVIIGDDAKVLPNSVVLPKTVIPPGETWGGVPAKKLGD